MVNELTTIDFKEKIFNYDTQKKWKFENDKPVIIDFWAPWCGPCKQTTPIIEEISNEYSDKLDVYSVNVDDEHELAIALGIKNIPTFLFIPNNGNDPEMIIGGYPKARFIQEIQKVLGI